MQPAAPKVQHTPPLPLCRLAALGTSLELKSRFGVGYTLTVSLAGSAAGAEAEGGQGGSAALLDLAQRHVLEARLLSATGGLDAGSSTHGHSAITSHRECSG